jgi:phospholipid/cholesterol/gamma-HCH transport system permease protein
VIRSRRAADGTAQLELSGRWTFEGLTGRERSRAHGALLMKMSSNERRHYREALQAHRLQLAFDPDTRLSAEEQGKVLHFLQVVANLRSTRERIEALFGDLSIGNSDSAHWDLTGIDDLDVAGATLLWRAWKGKKPAALALRPEDEAIFKQFAALPPPRAAGAAIPPDVFRPVLALGYAAESLVSHAFELLTLLGRVALSVPVVLRSPTDIPWREISATVYRVGLTSLPITALVGFLIGIVLSYLSAEQLHALSADELIVNLMGFACLRELGPLLAAILNAGRSGSSMTAQIGVMRVTSELEAMSVLGISHTVRLVLPRVVGQCIALPLVVVWTDVLALLGGMIGAKLQLGLTYQTFLYRLPLVVPLTDLWFGVCKGVVFGGLIALVGCYFGLRIRPDTEGLAIGTTQSVVTALTLILVADAIFAVLFANVGV